jgi:hypothetical protein
VTGGADEDQRRADQRREVQGGARAPDPGADGEVDVAVGHQVHHGPRIGGQDPDLDVRVRLAERPDRVDEVDAAGDEHGCDADRPAQQPLDLGDGVAGPFGVREDRARRLEQRPAGVGQLGAAATADEQLRAELTLERQQRAGEARLDQEDPGGGAGERALLDDGQEVLELSQFHSGQQTRCVSVDSAQSS